MSAARLRESGDDQLWVCLERALEAERGAPLAIVALERQPFAYETSFAIDRLKLRLRGGEELDLLVKDLSVGGLSPAAAAAKPAFTLESAREIAVYRSILSPAELSTPHFFGATVDERSGRAWLFLELVDGEVLTDVGELSIWEETAAWAARLGDRVPSQLPPEVDSKLLDRGPEWFAHWTDVAIAAGDGEGDTLAERLRGSREALLARLDSLPRSFLHGELYPANVVVQRRQGAPPRIAPVDWELAGKGPFALDLAALLSGWSGEDRRAMCEAFQASLPAERRPPLAELSAAADLCELALALQWIGWGEDWAPPATQRRDWRAEALRLLDEVGL